jgi:hypothetical protein
VRSARQLSAGSRRPRRLLPAAPVADGLALTFVLAAN